VKWFTKNVSPPTILRTIATKIAFSFAKKPALRPAFSFTSISTVVARATIVPASAIKVSFGWRETCSIGNDGSYLMTCCIGGSRARTYTESAAPEPGAVTLGAATAAW
jgi:hypothetical protein